MSRFTTLVMLVVYPLSPARPQTVRTTHGLITGTRLTFLNKQVDVFYGIPYAEPPLNNLRFDYPHPVDPWAPYTKTVQVPPPSCLQPSSMPPSAEPYRRNPSGYSEDCLYLNVWAPVNGQKDMAVLVFIHGGGFLQGSAQLPLYTGQYMAGEKDVLVVSINYRLGALGFLFLGPNSIPGNMGLMDQWLALEWIRNNVDYFGGDPEKITIFGESSGAASVGFHLLSPFSRNLFNNAILQSGTPISSWTYNDAATARDYSVKLGGLLGCPLINDMALMHCLVGTDPKILTNIQQAVATDGMAFLPVVDGVFLPDDPMTLMAAGNFKNACLLHGVVEDEATLLLLPLIQQVLNSSTPTSNVSLKRGQYDELLTNYLDSVNKNTRTDILSLFYETGQEPGTKADYVELLNQIRSDIDFKCPAIEFGSYFAQNNPTYLYSFGHRLTTNPFSKWVGVAHSYEMELVFGLPLNASYEFTTEEQELSFNIMTYWSNFAKTGNPNTPVPLNMAWPAYDNVNKTYLALDVVSNLATRRGLRHRECAFISQILPLIGQSPDNTQPQVSPINCPQPQDIFTETPSFTIDLEETQAGSYIPTNAPATQAGPGTTPPPWRIILPCVPAAGHTATPLSSLWLVVVVAKLFCFLLG